MMGLRGVFQDRGSHPGTALWQRDHLRLPLEFLYEGLFGWNFEEAWEAFDMTDFRCCAEMIVNKDVIRQLFS